MKLDDVRVLDLSQFLPGPHMTMLMADHGADVIKVEPFPEGDPVRRIGTRQGGHAVYFRNLNRGKRSLRLNLKQARGREALFRLAATADVMVETFRPGVAARLGINYEQIQPLNPKIVYCSLSAFGQQGGLRDKPAHDLAIEAQAGVLGLGRSADGDPVMPAVPAADMAGSLMALSGILMALLRQRRTGRGDYLDLSMHDSLLAWTPHITPAVFAGDRSPDLPRERLYGGSAFYNLYRTADRRHLALGGSEHKFAENFLNKAGRPDLVPLAHEPAGDAQAPLRAFLRDLIATRSMDDWLAWLADVDACYAPVLDLKSALDSQAKAGRGMLQREAAGEPHLGDPIRFADEPGGPRLAVPGLGEHSREVLREAGYRDGEIDAMLADGVI